jgi:acid phosphatase
LITIASFACAATTPAPVPAPTETAAVPCNPGHALVNAVLWVQSSAEYRAAALGTFAAARRSLDAALADPSWVGAAEETANDPSQPPAIVLDLDETAIDNGAFEARSIRAGTTYDPELWKLWVIEAAAKPVPGATEFLMYAKSRGVMPFYVTNRDVDEEEGTRKNLEKLGYPLTENADNLLVRGKRTEWGSDKSSRRAHVAASYRLLLLLGDDLNDFANAREKSIVERDEIITSKESWWGTRWFMVPNPMYGSWERAMIGSGGSPCEQLQKKVDALKP